MPGRIQSIENWVKVFADSVSQYGNSILQDSKTANLHFEKYSEAVKKLAEFGTDGLSALVPLLDDKRKVVRVTTATYLVQFSTGKALKVLESATRENDSAISMLAIVSLKRWELGSYLDPATGKEIQCSRKS